MIGVTGWVAGIGVDPCRDIDGNHV